MNTIPHIQLIDDRLEGTILLPLWKGFQSRQGIYGSLDSDEKSNGIFKLAVGGDMVMDNPIVTTEHLRAYEYLTVHAHAIQHALLSRLMAEYPHLKPQYGYNEVEANLYMPDVTDVAQFKNLIGLAQVHLLNVSKDGLAYVGYEFGCTWDDEHGLGFMTHRNRIVEFGDADMSFLTWVAEKDL